MGVARLFKPQEMETVRQGSTHKSGGYIKMPYLRVVRERRLELLRVAPLDPKSSASTNSATLAQSLFLWFSTELSRPYGLGEFLLIASNQLGVHPGSLRTSI
jgi:hypothetical protein